MQVNKSWYWVNAAFIVGMAFVVVLGVTVALQSRAGAMALSGMAIAVCGLAGVCAAVAHRRSVRKRDTS